MNGNGPHDRKKIRRPVVRGVFSLSKRMRIFPRLKWRWIVAAVLAVLLLGLAGAGVIFWRARRVLRSAAAEVKSRESLAFTVRKLPPASSSFEWISAPASFSGAAFFQGELYLCGAAGLFRYDSQGTLLKQYRPGVELPSTPLLRVTAGILRDAKEPELLMFTAT